MTDTAPDPSDATRLPTPRRPLWLQLMFLMALVLVLAVIGFTVYSMTLPNEWSVEVTQEIAAPPEEIFPYLIDLKRWPDWIAWGDGRDPTLAFTPDKEISEGVGGKLVWEGRAFGNGTVEIIESKPPVMLRYKFRIQGRDLSDGGTITLEPTDDGSTTQVTWTDGGVHNDPFTRMMADVIVDGLTADYQQSLERLDEQVTSEK
ncbi:SRPBCC family protein [Stratiformator vulcanicus]|uniref:Polyketide cyclase / dehydrase and lipid transport n=1 Tax=Stratiformator vulcanicus TaxID=2527980 RepID=A0A517R4X6_9PLAN|nr:SRPBCC family protein [Stratiformator vulcanicus]QDT38937.1 Polyketide cyclase / dehydrase and lipid transport [Stratiformator vulcanicus]